MSSVPLEELPPLEESELLEDPPLEESELLEDPPLEDPPLEDPPLEDPPNAMLLVVRPDANTLEVNKNLIKLRLNMISLHRVKLRVMIICLDDLSYWRNYQFV